MKDNLSFPRVVEEDGAWIVSRLQTAPILIPDDAVFTGDFSPLKGMDEIVRARIRRIRGSLLREDGFSALYRAERLRAYSGSADLSHTSPDWKGLLRLGLPGIAGRLKNAVECKDLSPMQRTHFLVGTHVWSAAIDYLERMATEAERSEKSRMAKGLHALCTRPPETLFEVLQLILVYYEFQQNLESTPVRTLGRLDALVSPYLEADLAAGRLTEEDAKDLFDRFLFACDEKRATANLPFALGGEDEAGGSLVCQASEWILERYIALALPNVKLHILCAPSTPKTWIRTALAGVRAGSNSMVFINDRETKSALRRLGIAEEDAADYTLVGCYEPCAAGEMPFSCSGKVNLLQAVETALFGGKHLLSGETVGETTPADFPDFASFLNAYFVQLRHFCRGSIQSVMTWEEYLPSLHTAPFLSATFESCIEKGGDVYADHAAKYNDSSINLLGLASAVDALSAIRKCVFEDGALTLDALREHLRTDWQSTGGEELRRTLVSHAPKYGTADPFCDDLARQIVSVAAEEINGKPNGRGGVFRMGGFSIDWCKEWGKGTGASADGRNAGAWLSKNLCATVGADREGVTGLILSAASLGGGRIFPNGAVLDVTLHQTAVAGDEGLSALEGTLRVFTDLGGMAIQYNVLDPGVLRRAQAHPEEYPNLQVRLCGWNVLFSSLTREEQETFIRRAEASA